MILKEKLKLLFFKNFVNKQKQYEALRMLSLENKEYKEVAKHFGYSEGGLRSLASLAVREKINFFQESKKGPKEPQTSSKIRNQIIKLRKQNKSIFDIQSEIKEKHNKEISVMTVQRVIINAGFNKLPRRTNNERGYNQKNTLIADRTKILDFNELKSFKIDCPTAGIFFFLPYIIESGIIDVVKKCSLPKSKDISSSQAALSMLLLKLIGNERLSHMQSYDKEPALGFFAGLNVLPKSTYMTTYSCRTSDLILSNLQQELISHLEKKYPKLYDSKYINLDFHSIPHFGNESQMENVWCGARGKTLKGANTLLAQDGTSNVIIYTKADILRKNETGEIKKFVEYWKKVNGNVTETLVFDCRLTKYEILGELDEEEQKIKFITLRKRNNNLLDETLKIPDSEWKKVRLPIPKRKHQNFLVHENEVILTGCSKPFRQIIIKDHGRQKPTFVITNNTNMELLEILEVYAKRWHIENKIAELVSFFNLNALSSPIMIRIHFDIFWTMIADTLYHLFAQDLPRFEKCRAKIIFKKFINFPGSMEFDGKEFIIKIRKRAHTPILLGVEKLTKSFKIPWLNNMPMKIEWTA
ncbi:MAG: transposase [Nanoarchaeota archaeon]|nr:transposase [Nanoarchaeota archaeon]